MRYTRSVMKKVIVKAFGEPDQLAVVSETTPELVAGQVLVRITSIGMNHADLMARRGEYKLISGDPPFVPGLEAGGVIQAVSAGVADRSVGDRVILTPDIRHAGAEAGTYRSHIPVDAAHTLPAPEALADEQLGSLWLAYLTAWGCLVWRQGIQAGQVVAMPAASSSVSLAAAQIAKSFGATTLALTRTQAKADRIRELPDHSYDHFVVTHDAGGAMVKWHRQIRDITGDRGVDCFFDPVAAGPYLDSEIKSLAEQGAIWVYGLLGEPDTVDVSPLIRKRAAIRGWMLDELILVGEDAWRPGCEHILDGFATGRYHQHVDRAFKLDDAAEAHAYMERGEHVGKLVLLP